jgi:hypothetical protein
MVYPIEPNAEAACRRLKNHHLTLVAAGCEPFHNGSARATPSAAVDRRVLPDVNCVRLNP